MKGSSTRRGSPDTVHASAALFEGILSIAADAVVTVDDQQRILHFNRGAEEIFGYREQQVIGQPLSVLLPDRFREAHVHHVDEFGRSREPARRMGHRREIFGLRKDGTEFPAEASISKLDLPDGRRVYTAVVRDITERKWTETSERFLAHAGAALARTLEYDAALTAIAEVPVPTLADACMLDVVEAGGIIRRVAGPGRLGDRRSRALRTLAERHPLTWDSPSEVIDVLRRGQPTIVEHADAAWLEAHEETEAAAALWREVGPRSLLIVPLRVGERPVGALKLIAIDPARRFTLDSMDLALRLATHAALALENARLYRAAQQATRAREQMLGVVSHDLRNPLSAITMCARVLRDAPPANESERLALLATIGDSAEWMNRLIQDLLDVASIEAGGLSLVREPERPRSLVLAALQMFEVEAADRSIELRADVAHGLPKVLADEGRVVQLLGNLVRNALKFTPDSGTITVGAESRDGEIVFSIRDQGPGIPPENQTRIFEHYWRATEGSRHRGAGLGLSISRGIAEAHGGRLWVESTIGHGATFFFSLPVGQDQAAHGE